MSPSTFKRFILGVTCLAFGLYLGTILGIRRGAQDEREQLVSVAMGKPVLFEHVCIFITDAGLRVTPSDRCPGGWR